MGAFGNAFSGWHLIVILLIVLLLFGSSRLPAAARGIGQALRIFKAEVKTETPISESPAPATEAEAPAPGTTKLDAAP
ncbi:twin-arginine translocase TatA/TatE family subunit [Gulosibacter sp. 10]|uniref:twin-arginine translocase TatA/TatE family subunit n=1 Tax=Gulosibacter sp. 10 TaxID=1255570 RepID=UPI00097ED89F|nr:twin-arginine translocase TatA/TatE family subunit [Gulosibacter sp. 10]SJM62863.1 Twin-arginine translocation protein TatA [Gulosibacter sp. 10]